MAVATADQRVAPDDFQDRNISWDELAVVQVPQGETSLTVRLTDAADDWVTADAVRLEQAYLPKADVTVSSDPANCIPSPESPQNRTTTDRRSRTGFAVLCCSCRSEPESGIKTSVNASYPVFRSRRDQIETPRLRIRTLCAFPYVRYLGWVTRIPAK